MREFSVAILDDLRVNSLVRPYELRRLPRLKAQLRIKRIYSLGKHLGGWPGVIHFL